MSQVRGLVERVGERAQPTEPARPGRAGPGEGDPQEGQQQSEPRQGGRHVRGGDDLADCPAMSFVLKSKMQIS